MTYPEFIVVAWLVVAGLIALMILLWGITPIGDKLDKASNDGTAIVMFLATAFSLVTTIICTIVFVTEHNERTQDFNYCESLELRGHETLMLEYNYFNRDCMINVDDQWIRIDDSAFGRNA